MAKYLDKAQRRLAVRSAGTWNKSKGENQPGSMNPRKSASINPSASSTPQQRSANARSCLGA